jgi:hypothetical protein
MRYFREVRGIVEELLLHNSYLTGKLEQSSGEDKNKGKAILNAVNRSLQASKRLEIAVTKSTKAENKGTPTYAEKVKMTSNSVAPKAVKPSRNVVIIRPDKEESEYKSSEEARDAVFTLINPRKKGIQVTAIRQIRGNGLVVETTNPEGLKAFTENAKLKDMMSRGISPRRYLYLQSCMKKQNQERLSESDVAAIKFCFRTGRKDQRETNWVIEVSPQVMEKLLKGKTFIAWHACKVRDSVAIRRCYKCQGYGHVAKYCRVNYDICAHCAESGHSTKGCPNKDNHPNCVNCKKAGKKGDHAASNTE